MSIADVLRTKGNVVVKVRAANTVMSAVHKLAEHRIGALVVEDPWLRIAGMFSERDFLNAIDQHGAAALSDSVEQFMSAPVVNCRPTDRVEIAMATMTLAKIRHLPVMDAGRLAGIVWMRRRWRRMCCSI
jgi:CBS domain-containing protein